MTDPYRAYNFQLRFAEDTLTVAAFNEASGLGAEVDVIPYREGGGVRHLPGRATHTPLTLKYGVTASRDLWEWINATLSGKVERKDIVLVMNGADGSPAITWTLRSAWPSSFQAAPLNAADDEIAIETLTLVYDGLERD